MFAAPSANNQKIWMALAAKLPKTVTDRKEAMISFRPRGFVIKKEVLP